MSFCLLFSPPSCIKSFSFSAYCHWPSCSLGLEQLTVCYTYPFFNSFNVCSTIILADLPAMWGNVVFYFQTIRHTRNQQEFCLIISQPEALLSLPPPPTFNGAATMAASTLFQIVTLFFYFWACFYHVYWWNWHCSTIVFVEVACFHQLLWKCKQAATIITSQIFFLLAAPMYLCEMISCTKTNRAL